MVSQPTVAECSSGSTLGIASVPGLPPPGGVTETQRRAKWWLDHCPTSPAPPRESNSFGPGWYGHATDIHGVSGEPPESVAFPDGICGRDFDHRAHDWQTNAAAGSFWFHCPGKSFAWERENRRLLGGGS